MRLLRLAIEAERWDLAAHTLVLAAARLLRDVTAPDRAGGEKSNVARKRKGIQTQAQQDR